MKTHGIPSHSWSNRHRGPHRPRGGRFGHGSPPPATPARSKQAGWAACVSPWLCREKGVSQSGFRHFEGWTVAHPLSSFPLEFSNELIKSPTCCDRKSFRCWCYCHGNHPSAWNSVCLRRGALWLHNYCHPQITLSHHGSEQVQKQGHTETLFCFQMNPSWF